MELMQKVSHTYQHKRGAKKREKHCFWKNNVVEWEKK